jgi:hypothetical protein
MKARQKHTQESNRERSDGECGIVDTNTPRKTAETVVNELVSVLYTCQPDVQQFRSPNLVKVVAPYCQIEPLSSVLLYIA